MTLQSARAAVVLQAMGCVAILGLAVAVFLALPERLAFNNFVAGTVFGATILLLTIYAQVTHPGAEPGRPTGHER